MYYYHTTSLQCFEVIDITVLSVGGIWAI